LNSVKIRKKIIEVTKNSIREKLNLNSEGNVSFKLGDQIYITPSGINGLSIKESDICQLSLKGDIKGKKKPSSELSLHLKIYENFSDINSIVHTHSMWASIISCMQLDIPSFHYMVAEFGGDNIRCAEYATFGTVELGAKVVKALNERNGCLLSNHGQVTIGKNLDEAFSLSKALEKISKQYYFCFLSKTCNILDKKEMKKILNLFSDYKSKY
tara:strand:+ start:852 stop:1490 length:639 start_codon:yes stop_codon:yes gene_type:complete